MQTLCHRALASLLLTAAAGPVLAEEERTAWRLFVSDHQDGIVSVLDPQSGETLARLPIGGPASLYRTESGKTVHAVQGAAGRVTAIASGIAFDDHGEHRDIEVGEARLLDVTFEGDSPSHFVEHHGDIALFFDGEGAARITTEAAILDGSVATEDHATDAPHHGAAAVFASHLLVSAPDPADPDELPIGIGVLTLAGEPVGDLHECPELHGEASSGNLMAFACATGLLVVRSQDGAPQVEHLAYPDGLPDGAVTTVIGGRGLQYFLGNYGPDAVVLVDPSAEEAFRLIELPTRRVHFAVDPIRAKYAYVFTEDGTLHRLDVLAGEVAGSLPLTEPYSMDGEWSDPRPRVAVAGDQIAVTDPLRGLVHLVDAESFETAGEVAVEGMPFNVVAIGGTGFVPE